MYNSLLILILMYERFQMSRILQNITKVNKSSILQRKKRKRRRLQVGEKCHHKIHNVIKMQVADHSQKLEQIRFSRKLYWRYSSVAHAFRQFSL